MCIGNDVVDLATVEHHKPDSYWRRVFSLGEYEQYVGQAFQPAGRRESLLHSAPSHLWRAWAAKEAAFKMLRQAGILRTFVPSLLSYCDRTARIRCAKWTWPVHVSQSARLVSAVVSESVRYASIVGEISSLAAAKSDLYSAAELEEGSLHWPRESIAVRVLAKRYLARHFHCAPSAVVFSAPNKYSQPRGSICGRSFDRGLSFSHDGRFAAVAISERLLG